MTDAEAQEARTIKATRARLQEERDKFALLQPHEKEMFRVLVRDRRGVLKLSRHAYTRFYELSGATGASASEKRKLRDMAKGVVAVFLLGFFWARTNTAGAFALLISSVVLSIAAKLMLPDLPFVLRIWIVFLVCLVVGVVVSLLTPKPKPEQPVDLGGIQFDTKVGFNIAAVLIVLILAAIYVAFW